MMHTLIKNWKLIIKLIIFKKKILVKYRDKKKEV